MVHDENADAGSKIGDGAGEQNDSGGGEEGAGEEERRMSGPSSSDSIAVRAGEGGSSVVDWLKNG